MSAGLPLRSYERSAPKKDSMKQFILLIVCLFVSTFASATEQQAIVTFYWPGEMGGRLSSDGATLRDGDAAVDFNFVPKGTALKLVGSKGIMQITAVDHGGRNIMNRKAANGLGSDVMVIDVWVKSASVARSKAKMMGEGTVTVQHSDGSLYSCPAIIVVSKPAVEAPRILLKFENLKLRTPYIIKVIALN